MKKILKKIDEMTIAEKLAVKNGYAIAIEKDVNGIEKAIDTPASFRIGGVLNPEEVDSLVMNVQKQSKLLDMIDIKTINGTTCNLNDFKTSEDGTHAPGAFGTLPSDTTTNITNPGNTVTLYPLQELYLQKDAVTQSMLWKPNFQNSVMNALNIQWSNSLAKLGMIGTAFTAGSFAAMLKGFIQLFVDGVATVNNIVFADYTDMIALLSAAEQNIPEKYADAPDLTHFVKKSDYDKLWALRESAVTTGLAYNNANGSMTFNGHPVVWINGMPTANAFFTPKSNLVLVISADNMKVETERHALFAADAIVMNYMAAYGVYNYEAVVHAS